MSLKDIRAQASSKEEVYDQLREVLEPHTTSCQAKGDVQLDRHNDGEQMYKEFGLPPLHKYMAKAERHDKFIARYPQAFVDAIVHVSEREIELLEAVAEEYADRDYRYDPSEWRPDHPVLDEEFYPLRAKMLEWICADKDRVDCLVAGGTDVQAHGSPGSGKTTLGLSLDLWKMQVNNETVLWADTMDDSGVNDRTEWLAFAPWTTLALPEGFPVRVRVIPDDPTVDAFEVPVSEICRDVVRYSSPRDLCRQLLPGQFYVVFPDPALRGCSEVSNFAFHGPQDLTPVDEPGPSSRTPMNHWWFAFFAARITYDDFLHWTTVSMDEAGNMLHPDSSKDAHETYQKVTWFAEKFADFRKKGASFDSFTHALSELHPNFRAKQRWWLTMNGTKPPLSKSLPGGKTCPMKSDWTSDMDKGEGKIWTTQNHVPVSWPNLKRKKRLDASISIEFPTVGGVA